MPEEKTLDLSSRCRSFLKSSTFMAGTVPVATQTTPPASPANGAKKDSYAVAKRFNKFLRVTDVTDGLDAFGCADLTLMDPAIRP